MFVPHFCNNNNVNTTRQSSGKLLKEILHHLH